jgi:hypothetical protein
MQVAAPTSHSRILIRIAAGIVSLAIAGVGSAAAQSLAELAKQEEARRKAAQAGTKVYTNRDLGRVEPKPAPVPATPAAPAGTGEVTQAGASPAAQPAAAAQPAPEASKGDEKYWRERVAQAQDELARTEVLLAALESRINALTTDFVNRDDPVQRETIAQDRLKALAERDRTRGEVERFKKKIADIQDEARKLGVPPGWLR